MKSPLVFIGLILIILGIASLAYQGFTYTKHETVAQIGNMQVTADTQKTVYLSPIVGGLMLAAGCILVFINRKNSG